MEVTEWLILIFSVIFGSIIAEILKPTIIKLLKRNNKE